MRLDLLETRTMPSRVAQNKGMPKSRQRKGDFPRVSGARRKDNITWISDLDHRKEIGLSRILGIFDKAKQLSLFTGYKVSVVVQPPENELATLMFSTNDDLFSNMATLVRRFGPRWCMHCARSSTEKPADQLPKHSLPAWPRCSRELYCDGLDLRAER